MLRQSVHSLAICGDSRQAFIFMICLIYRSRVLASMTAMFIAGLNYGLAATPATPSADEIISKAVQRAESAASHAAHPDYRYTKRTVTEELDTKGRLKE